LRSHRYDLECRTSFGHIPARSSQQIFRAPSSEQIFEADVRSTILNALYTTSGEPPPEQRWKFAIEPKEPASAIAQASRKLALWRTGISRS
jgi:hypothetical protein